MRYAILAGLLVLASCAVPEPCVAQCGERVCGLDPVCGEPCGSCFDDERCSDAGTCEVICDTADCGPDGCTFDVDVRPVNLSVTVDWPSRPPGVRQVLTLFPSHAAHDAPSLQIPVAGGAIPAGVWDIYVGEHWGPMARIARHQVVDGDTTLEPPTILGARINAVPGWYALREPDTGRLLADLEAIEGERVDFNGPPPYYLRAWQGTFDVFWLRDGILGDEELLAESFTIDTFVGATLPVPPPFGSWRVEVIWNGAAIPAGPYARFVDQRQRAGVFDRWIEHRYGYFLARDVVVRAGEETIVQATFDAAQVSIEYRDTVSSGSSVFLGFEAYGADGVLEGIYKTYVHETEPGLFRGAIELPFGAYTVNVSDENRDVGLGVADIVVDGDVDTLSIERRSVAVTVDISYDGVAQPQSALLLQRMSAAGKRASVLARDGALVDAGLHRAYLADSGAFLQERVVDDTHAHLAYDLDMVRVRGTRGTTNRAQVGEAIFELGTEATSAFELQVPAGKYDVAAEFGGVMVPVGNCVLLDDTESP